MRRPRGQNDASWDKDDAVANRVLPTATDARLWDEAHTETQGFSRGASALVEQCALSGPKQSEKKALDVDSKGPRRWIAEAGTHTAKARSDLVTAISRERSSTARLSTTEASSARFPHRQQRPPA
ncbi:hypothetical protein AAFF_G00434190 [Aldrovandia affinis]|uniref:Uncharacterized protein n=1 Tax=Aldrovandia affinis TaxID=143900 RepID=A0AAD7S848_9TELE|nr:hypothetical protein AAFF_G00434190 [Aldrovandia affinis]